MMGAAPPPSPAPTAVFDVLSQSRATLLHSAALGDGLDVALWRNSRDETEYRRPGHHTLSLYLSGGEGTFRADQPGLRGAPGLLCLLPAGHESHWVVGGEQRFLHLYFRAEQLAPLALRLLDREPREVGLPELTFVRPEALVQPLQAISRLDWTDPQARLQANALGHGVLAELIGRHSARALDPRRRGGLSPAVRRSVVDRIDAELHQPLTVGEMAAWASLSEHHFAQAFRESVGQTPHAFVLARRIDKAKALLRQHPHWPLALVAHACGLASASHLVRRFQAQTGVSPAKWRTLLTM
jgi:AraC family transcriptional regulator